MIGRRSYANWLVAAATSMALLLVGLVDARAEVRTQVRYAGFVADVESKVRAHDFIALDRQAERLRKSRARFPDGYWKLAAFHDGLQLGLSAVVADDGAWPGLETQLREVARRRSRSGSAWVMLALAIDQRAWAVRGTGFANTVSPEQFARFRPLIVEERAILDAHRAARLGNPHWFATRILTAVYGGEGAAAVDALFVEGVRREPRYIKTYMSALLRHTPRWGGSVEDMTSFVAASAAYATTDEGTAPVAWLAWYAYKTGYLEVMKNVEWSLMRQSMLDVLAAYPDDWNAQKYLVIACEHGDKPLSIRIVRDVHEDASPTLLETSVSLYENCRKWAQDGVPFAVRNPSTGEMSFRH